jgi:hypothetical protein
VVRTKDDSSGPVHAAAKPPRGFLAARPLATALALATGLGMTLTVISGSLGAAHAVAATRTDCSPKPSRCGFPDATNSGVPAGTPLTAVPGQATSGPGWAWKESTHTVVVSTDGTVISDLHIHGVLNITASNVTVDKVEVTSNGDPFGITLRHTKDVTIEHSTIGGANITTGRIGAAIHDVYGDATNTLIKDNDIFFFKTAIQITTGTIVGNYMRDPGFVAGDHTNGVLAIGTTQPLLIRDNTILDDQEQTDAVSLGSSGPGQPVANKTVEDNLLGGGGYAIYGGATHGNTTSNIVIKNNVISQLYWPKGGFWGPVAYFNTAGAGNVWAGNTWDTTGAVVPAP